MAQETMEEQMTHTLETIISRVKKDFLWVLITLVIALAVGIGVGELLFI